jgi:hypothetical protein
MSDVAGRVVKLELSDEERRTVLRLVRDALDASRFPLSPEAEMLHKLAERLKGALTQGRGADGG